VAEATKEPRGRSSSRGRGGASVVGCVTGWRKRRRSRLQPSSWGPGRSVRRRMRHRVTGRTKEPRGRSVLSGRGGVPPSDRSPGGGTGEGSIGPRRARPGGMSLFRPSPA
jgi:hypothetical protein